MAVSDEREHYKTLKYMYVAPIHIPMYLFGRGVAKFVVGSISVLITIVFGMLFLHLRIELAAVNWPLFFLALMIGVIMLVMMGLILGILVGLTVIFGVLAIYVFRWAEHRAKERGLIDMVTNY